jgi:myo-inositol-1(or 4)-monophosphatase
MDSASLIRMNPFLQTAIDAAREAGKLLRENFGRPLDVKVTEAHDIKLELDVRSQELITRLILSRYPDHAIYGEEGITGNQEGEFQWIVDPIDGTVNYFYNLPHFCVSIALRQHGVIIVGVIYDPMRNELWAVEKGGPATLNGIPCRVSQRNQLSEAMITVGFSKSGAAIEAGIPLLQKLAHKVRKCRMMGSAALDLAYITSGRLDAYIESSISLWDIAAGMLLLEAAGGRVDLKPHADNPDKFAIMASSGNIDFNI